VTLFASGDPMTNAKLVPARRLRSGSTQSHDPIPHYMVMLDKVMRHAPKFDILHFHIDHLQFPLVREGGSRSVTTLHGRQDMPDSALFYSYFRHAPVVSISHAQRGPIQDANFVGTVHHGLPLGLHRASVHADSGYLAFLGRISPEKDPVTAIRTARAAKMKLKIAARSTWLTRLIFASRFIPLLDGPDVEFIGELSEQNKATFSAMPARCSFRFAGQSCSA
jgi:glycosyltransferase involved in cell wall biosynthesis